MKPYFKFFIFCCADNAGVIVNPKGEMKGNFNLNVVYAC